MTTQPSPDFPYRLVRAGVVMRPDRNDPMQEEGVCNPAAAWSPDGRLVMYPRVVAKGNRSRIAEGTVQVTDGVPSGFELTGITLAPDQVWEHGADHGGVEDPRLTHIEQLGLYLMTYIAYGPLGPRPALLVSEDMQSWRRLGPIQFEYDEALAADLNLYTNKDVLWFPEPVPGPDGSPCLALLHRPTWEFPFLAAPVPEVSGDEPGLPAGITDPRPAIWIGFVRLEDAVRDPRALLHVWGNCELAHSEFEWEALKVGGGPPPLRVPEGWLLLHHGVSGSMSPNPYEPQKQVLYVAGGMILSADDPRVVTHRTSEPLLAPQTDEEKVGIVGNVVFPTAIVEVEEQLFTFYGMADDAIGVARIERVGS